MNGDESLLHAYLDGELDAAGSRALEARLAEDAVLRTSLERLRVLSAEVRAKADYHAAPARFRAAPRAAALQEPAAVRRWFRLAPAFAAVALLAFGVGVFVSRPGEEEALAGEAVASHVRATLGARLFDVASSDQHTVKPWLSSRLPYSPPVVDLSHEGFELAGARLDYLSGQPVAVLVYKRRQHVVDVFVWPGGEEPARGNWQHDGFNVERFAKNGMRYWLVSDLNRNELGDLARLLGRPG